jgi:type VI protein secretion system component VasF
MNEEAEMRALASDISSQIAAGRETIERSLEEETQELEAGRIPPAGYVAAGMVGLLALGVVGWMFYRSRRRRTLVQRLQDALPDTVRQLPTRVRKARSI